MTTAPVQPYDRRPQTDRLRRSVNGPQRSRLSRTQKLPPSPHQLVFLATLFNLVGIGLLWVSLTSLSERSWLTSVLTFLPRSPWLVPSVALIIAGAIWNRRSVPWNIIAAGFVLLAVMDYRWGRAAADAPPGAQEVRIYSCNVQRFQPDFELILEEISRTNPDVVLFQEARDSHPLFHSYFQDWHRVHQGEFFIASRWPLNHNDLCQSKAYMRPTALHATLETPAGAVDVFNVHLMTPRHGLAELNPRTLLTGEAAEAIRHHLHLREAESLQTRRFVTDRQATGRIVVAGDFNAPTSSSLVNEVWAELTSAFDTAGYGFGYTAPCSEHRLWLDGVPWVRIDHILVNGPWGISAATAGKLPGSDHRSMSARLWFQPDMGN